MFCAFLNVFLLVLVCPYESFLVPSESWHAMLRVFTLSVCGAAPGSVSLTIRPQRICLKAHGVAQCHLQSHAGASPFQRVKQCLPVVATHVYPHPGPQGAWPVSSWLGLSLITWLLPWLVAVYHSTTWGR